MTVLVTGATGFVGRAVCARMLSEGRSVLGVIRAGNDAQHGIAAVKISTLDNNTDWAGSLNGVRDVVHLAARVHVTNERACDPLAEFRRVNVDGTLNLARQAAAAGLRRFVFVSSVKVNGETTQPGHPFTADDSPAPADDYGMSKCEAEQGLWRIAVETGMQVVVVRPPLVYGPGVKANFEKMMWWVARGIPLPLGSIDHNRRSLIALDNLVDLLCVCLDHPNATGRTLMASDDEDLSTTDLLRRLANAMGVRAHLVKVPTSWLIAGANLFGQEIVVQRLLGNLQVDSSATRTLLGWHPPLTVDQGVQRAVEGWRRWSARSL